MVRSRVRATAAAVLAAACGLVLLLGAPAHPQDRSVLVTEATGPVTPVMADHLEDAVAAAERGDHEALVVRMDTPGGLVDTMRRIVQLFLGADVPVMVWVGPSGAGAASAGYVIGTSGHVFAMAPGTNTGAATPIEMEGGEVHDKVLEDAVSYVVELAELRDRDVEFAEDSTREGASVGASEAEERGVVDVITPSIETLLDEVDGMDVTLDEDRPLTLATAGATLVEFEMSWTRTILQALANPNLAFIFFALAPLAILWEIANPGMGVGAIAGGIMLIIALYSLAVLPVNLAGLALLALAIVLFIIEAFVPGTGAAAGGGAVALVLSGLFLFQRPTGIGVDWWVIAPTAIFTALIAVGLAVLVRRAWQEEPATGEEAYAGRRAEVRSWDRETGQVWFDGALWRARSDDHRFAQGDRVRIVERDGLDLLVEPYQPQPEDGGASGPTEGRTDQQNVSEMEESN